MERNESQQPASFGSRSFWMDLLEKVFTATILKVVIVLGTLGVGVVIGFICGRHERIVTTRVEGRIEAPASGSVVERTVDLSGTLNRIPSNHHAIIIVELRDQNGDLSYFPKEGKIEPDKDGRWNHTIYEDGPSKTISVGLWLANELGRQRIEDWLIRGKQVDSFPAMRDTIGLVRVHRVDDLVVAANNN